jgi:hypothetical protein
MIDLAKLAGQGRAFSAARPWTPEELEALLTLERERELDRAIAANYVRNGIQTVEDYDNAVKASFKPATLEDAAADAEASLLNHGNAFKSAAVEAAAPKAKAKAKSKTK